MKRIEDTGLLRSEDGNPIFYGSFSTLTLSTERDLAEREVKVVGVRLVIKIIQTSRVGGKDP